MKYINAKELGIMGKAFPNAPEYTRLEEKDKLSIEKVNPNVASLSADSAGLHIDFSTTSKRIVIRWSVKENVIWSAITGLAINGIDAYIKTDSKWTFLTNLYPNEQSSSHECEIMNRETFETYGTECPSYSLNLTYSNEITSVEIGIEDDSQISLCPMNQEKPIVAYGTSICHGYYVSRPGLVYSNQLRRMLNQEVCNLGFSGSAKSEPEMTDILCRLDPKIMIFDPIPNMAYEKMEPNFTYFYTNFRKNHSTTPIIFMEQADYLEDHTKTNIYRTSNGETAKNKILEKLFAEWSKKDKNIYLLTSDVLYTDYEETFDGLHPNDTGATRLAKSLAKLIATIKL